VQQLDACACVCDSQAVGLLRTALCNQAKQSRTDAFALALDQGFQSFVNACGCVFGYTENNLFGKFQLFLHKLAGLCQYSLKVFFTWRHRN